VKVLTSLAGRGVAGANLVGLAVAEVEVALAVAAPLRGQDTAPHPSTGKGFLFGEPTGTFSLRAGYSRANAGSDLFTLQRQQLTIGPRGFDALSLGADLGFNVSRRLEVGVSLDGTTRSDASEYRNWLDNNNQPIKQTTSLSTVGLSANLKYSFHDRGRTISNFAWIPSHYVPYVGVGAGVIRYDFTQKGDFIDFQTKAVNSDELNAANWGAMAQLFTGLSYTLGPRYSLLTEARYTLSSASLNKDYSDLGRIDLSGLDQLFDFGDRDFSRHSAERIEITRRFVKDQISGPVADARAHERKIADDAALENVVRAVEGARLFLWRLLGDTSVGVMPPGQSAVGDLCSDAGRCIKCRNPAASRAQAFGQRSLRNEFHF